jgi:formate dehydrogenase beta subunit
MSSRPVEKSPPGAMPPTDTAHPDHFHKVVDCQWACPAHTDVPEYIRLIAQGEFTEAYLVNRASNVFPGILGRVCDRPCEPACRRGRVEDKPVAICRLKRVAADLKDDFEHRVPKRTALNGKRVACIGAGPASLTVANDLLPLGYEVVVFEQHRTPGGLMRTNIPSFRLPESVLADEIGVIERMGADIRLGHGIKSLRELLGGSFDAVFVGAGAPKGKELDLPGRREGGANIHIGIAWLESIAFGHLDKIGKQVLIIGVGNTAMDCCRSSLRLGAKSVKVMARKPRGFFKASDWELEDAESEGVEIVVNHSPKAFVVEGGKLVGMRFDLMEYEVDAAGRITKESTKGEVTLAADDVILAIGQENAFPWIERDLGIEFDKWSVPKVDPVTFQSTRPGVFFGGDAAFGPKNIIWAVEHGHQAAISIHKHCQRQPVAERLPRGVNLQSRKMGLHEWAFKNDYNPVTRQLVPHVSLKERFKKLNIEVELGFTAEEFEREVQRCLNCDVQTVFSAPACIECDACIDICPVDCLTMTHNGAEADLSGRLTAKRRNLQQPLFVSAPLKQTGRVMVKDEDLCVHCGLCAERCPTAAWDMQKSIIKIPYAVDEAK